MTHVIGYGQAFVGIMLVVISVTMVVRGVTLRRRQSSWQSVQGTVDAVDIRTTMNGANAMDNGAMVTGSRTYMIVDYSYRSIDGGEHRGRGRVQNLRLAMGGGEQTVDLLVDPADPSRSIINSSSGSLVLAVIVAAVFIAVGVGFTMVGFHLANSGTM